MADKQLRPLRFPTLARGWSPSAAPRTLRAEGDGPLWIDLQNLSLREGRLARREALASLSAGSVFPTIQRNHRRLGSTDGNAQVPLAIISDNQQNDDVHGLVCITTRGEIHLYRAGAWFNLTPVYQTGTVSITSGTTLVTAASGTPSWQDNGIASSQLIELPKLSGIWHRIASVANPTLTLAEPYTGPTLSSQAYQIRRQFAYGDVYIQYNVFAEVFNNDLYVAGPAPYGGLWVLRVDGIFGLSPSPASILASSYYLPGIDSLDDVGVSPECQGLAVLDDGRIVLAVREATTYKSRVYYSSHLNQAVWSAAPGGYTDVTANPGTIRALARMGANLAVHYDSGIALAVPTGEDDPPLAFRRTVATVGCYAPRTLRMFEGVQAFLARDGNVYGFDGASVRPMGDPVRFHTRDRRRSRFKAAHASVDTFRREYHLYLPQYSDSIAADEFRTHADQTQETLRYTFVAELGQWTKAKFATLIGAASDTMDGEPLLLYKAEGGRYKGSCLVGIPSYDPHPTLSGGAGATISNMLFKLSEAAGTDYATNFVGTSSAGGVFGVTDDHDCDLPGIDKTVSHVTVWLQSTETRTESVEVGLSKDCGSTWTTAMAAVNLSATDEVFAHFFFAPATGEKWRVRLGFPAGLETSAMPTRMVLWYAVVAEVEAVSR